MNDHSLAVLSELKKSQGISQRYLEQELNLTQRQIGYAIQLINHYLTDNGFSEIRKRKGAFYLDQKYLDFCQENGETISIKDVVFSSQDRQYMIILFLLNREDMISIDHLTHFFNVSRNTIWTDLKKGKLVLEKLRLTLKYERLIGYSIEGNEWDKRLLITSCIKKIYLKYNEHFLYQLMNNSESLETIYIIKNKISEIENELKIQYSDNDWNTLLFSLVVIINRIEQGKKLEDMNFNIHYQELSDTNEYKATEHFLINFPNISENDRLFITLQLLTNASKNFDQSTIHTKDLALLNDSLANFLSKLESYSLITIWDKQSLLQQLMKHFKPAYYRIKYHLTTNYAYLEKIKTQYQVLYSLIKESLEPLETFFGTSIPEEEILLLTLFIGGHLLKSESIAKDSITLTKAVVICTSGVSMSNIMRMELQKIFPDIYFLPPMSKREYENYQGEYDIVFSSIPIQTKSKKVFLINELLSAEEKVALQSRVARELCTQENKNLSAELMTIIKKYSVIKNQSELEKELVMALTTKKRLTFVPPKKELELKKVSLVELLTEDFIQISNVSTWREAVQLSLVPLLENNYVTEKYSQKMLSVFEKPTAEIVLRQNIALPHLAPKDGVKKLGFSLVINRKDIAIGKSTINLFVAISPIDNASHLLALSQLVEISKNEQLLTLLKSTTSKKECINVLNTHFSEGNAHVGRTIG